MINNNLTYLLLIAHVLGDYHLQSESLAKAKITDIRALFKHLFIHAILLLVIGLLHPSRTVFYVLICVIICHTAIDFLKKYLSKYSFHKISEKYLYIFDQVLHIGCILFLSEYLFASNIYLLISTEWIKWFLAILLITKPANITFKICFNQFQNYSNENSQNYQTVPGAGATIGNLERLLSIIFLSTQNVSSIGLIYTAKSIARFREIEKNQGFAEYYLIGTLYSILYVLLVYYLLLY